MKGYTNEQWQQAEDEVRKRAEEAAYKASENIERRSIQSVMYNHTKYNIILGARMMEEELRKTEINYETQKTTD